MYMMALDEESAAMQVDSQSVAFLHSVQAAEIAYRFVDAIDGARYSGAFLAAGAVHVLAFLHVLMCVSMCAHVQAGVKMFFCLGRSLCTDDCSSSLCSAYT